MVRLLAHGFAFVAAATAPALAAQLSGGASHFLFEARDGLTVKPITVWTYRPKDAVADAPVLIVMHGVQRDGRRYRDQWQEYAQRANALLLAPEFSAESFAGSAGYSAARLEGKLQPPRAYAIVEAIFDQARQLTGLSSNQYRLYGHSAGAQFVHRMVMFQAAARAKVAVAANAGWYMMPDFSVGFPFGLDGSGIDEARLKAAFAQKLVILLGELDKDPQHATLNRSTRAMVQGRHRFERGAKFFHAARQTAENLGTPFHWQLAAAPGADHDNAKMTPAAAHFVFDNLTAK
jgi:hypothetical protein